MRLLFEVCIYTICCVCMVKCIVAHLCAVVSPQQREFLVWHHVWFLLGVGVWVHWVTHVNHNRSGFMHDIIPLLYKIKSISVALSGSCVCKYHVMKLMSKVLKLNMCVCALYTCRKLGSNFCCDPLLTWPQSILICWN